MKQQTQIDKYLFHSTRNIFLTGQAGTGKTTLIKKFIEENPNTIVCAPTGVAAVNAGGDTMHKVFSIPVPAYGASISKVTPSKLKELMLADNIIIDEISMCRNDVFSFAIKVLRKAEKLKGKKIRLIVVGDFSQLPPVVSKNDVKYLKKFKYDESGYVFTTTEWKTLNFKIIELTEVYRQENQEFIDNLNKARIHDISCIPYFNQFLLTNSSKKEDDLIYICGTNAEADRLNKEYLDNLDGIPVAYQAEKKGRCGNTNIDDIILLKENARVYFTINDQIYNKYQNGTFGIVKSLNEKYVDVEILNNQNKKEIISVYPHKYSIYSYKVKNNNLTKEEIGSISQIPLKLAKAITIHKSQGKTFYNVILSPQIFAPGQLYVALSRVRSPEGFFLQEPILEEYLKIDKKVEEFYKNGYKYEKTVNKKQKSTTTKPSTKTKTTSKTSLKSTKKNSNIKNKVNSNKKRTSKTTRLNKTSNVNNKKKTNKRTTSVKNRK